MNELHQILTEKIPGNVLAQIVFLDKWEEPPNFKKISKAERIQLLFKYKPVEVEPTASNYWIWFGAYSSKDQQPILNNTRVSRAIYEAFHGPLKNPDGTDKRLVNALVETLADVNIYKFIPSFGNRFRSITNHIQENGMKVNYGQLLTEQQKKTNDFRIKQAFETLVEHEESFKLESEQRIALTALGYEPHIINSTLEKFNEYIRTKSGSHLVEGNINTSGTPQSSLEQTDRPTTSQPETGTVLDGQNDT